MVFSDFNHTGKAFPFSIPSRYQFTQNILHSLPFRFYKVLFRIYTNYTDITNNLVDEVRELGYKFVDYILELKDIDNHWKEMCELIKPEGAIASITENRRPINLRLLTQKKAIFAWEWMYTKSYYHTNDMQTQHDILEKIAYFLDNGQLKCTLTHSLSPLNATNLRKAHSLVESGHMVGKVVVSGWKE